MSTWKKDLYAAKVAMQENETKTRKAAHQEKLNEIFAEKNKAFRAKLVNISLPEVFTFKEQGAFNIDRLLGFFDWSLKDVPVKIDFTSCRTANYQALSLLVLYAWRLKSQGCKVSFNLDGAGASASNVWRMMGAHSLFQVLMDERINFKSTNFKPLFAIRNVEDFKSAIGKAEQFAGNFNVEYVHTLRYILSELLYNTLEHGPSYMEARNGQTRLIPSIIQFTWYARQNEMFFLVADTGIGIKKHLSRAYPGLETDIDAIRHAIKPEVSGTFANNDPYKAKNNAGVGLFISSNIVRKLKADMHILSGNGLVHISPRDTTSRTLENSWPGTLAIVSLKLDESADFTLHSMMQEFRVAARKEVEAREKTEAAEVFHFYVENFFGPLAEDKGGAIKARDERIMPAVTVGKKIIVDFQYVEYSPHSFLSALLATPIKNLGVSAYKKIKIINATPEIRETLDYIFEENTE